MNKLVSDAYPYEHQGKSPHAPYIQVKLSNPVNLKNSIRCKALLDTGADRTFAPKRYLNQLEVNVAGKPLFFNGFNNNDGKDSEKQGSNPYVISIELDQKVFKGIEVFDWSCDFVLIGRDLLNDFHIEFNGPSLSFNFNY
jgi:hypothetical protein